MNLSTNCDRISTLQGAGIPEIRVRMLRVHCAASLSLLIREYRYLNRSKGTGLNCSSAQLNAAGNWEGEEVGS